MIKACKNCQTQFEVTQEDLKFYDKVSPVFNGVKYSIPAPTLCPDCRQVRRHSYRNERNIYRRKSSLSGKNIISILSDDKDYIVYNQEEWWSDSWDSMNYAQDFDFSCPFFEQFDNLMHKVPHISLRTTSSENSEYTNLSGYNKNCYLLFAGEYNEDCMYAERTIESANCIDTSEVSKSKYCYSSVNLENCYKVFFSENCKHCSDSMFVYNCRSIKNCIFCSNIVNKEYCIRNKQLSQEDYFALKREILKEMNSNLEKVKDYYKKFKLLGFHRASIIMNCENCTGDHLMNSKNLEQCFDCTDVEDSKYTFMGYKVKDLLDVTNTTEQEVSYESMSVGYKSYSCLFTNGGWTCNNTLYCFDCHNSSDIFGCVGVRNKQFCILNKQYTEEEYNKIMPMIIEHMMKTKEFGEFFPIKYSPYGFNESAAFDYTKISKEQALEKGYKWKEINKDEYKKSDESACSCERCNKYFKTLDKEVSFYKENLLPSPKKCHDCRYKERLAMRNPRQLFDRKCMKCGAQVKTTFAEDRPETIYCEECYLKEVY